MDNKTSGSLRSSLQLPPLSLYIHIPWCVKKCPYCDFNSHEAKTIPEADYIAALKADLQQDLPWVQGRKLHSIFFGGGTPSLFSAAGIGDIIHHVEKTIGFEPNIEITLEANPGTIEQQKFTDFFHAGLNRLSIGIQSFQEHHLKKLGRIHNSDEAKKAMVMAKKAGFGNINLDLMHGLPEQSLHNALDDLHTAIDFEPTHISWYQLTIEPNTVFFREPPPLPADDALADIQAAGQCLLADNGYQQYEVSAYSRDNQQARHNLNYWSFGDYLGIGAGAHGKFTDVKNNTIVRRQKTRLPDHYLNYQNANDQNKQQAAPSYKQVNVVAEELSVEFMMNALRLTDGVPLNYFEQRTGLAYRHIEPILLKLIHKGLLVADSTQLKTTPLGQQYLNSLLADFMS